MTDYTELVEALRHCVSDEKGVTKCAGCPYYPDITGCMDRLHTDAAAAIEALETEIRESMQKCAECGDRMVEPKRGKWILQASGQDCKCSACGAYWIPFGDEYDYKFCPNCGADMRKMEVQE